MKKFIVFLFLTLFVGLHSSVLADGYHGHVTLSGFLGEDTPFDLELEYYQSGPSIIKGQTVYTRKNGKKSYIPVYGYWENETSGAMHITEVYNNKVCGTFEFTITEELDDEMDWRFTPVEGFWKLDDKVLPFKDVKWGIPNWKHEAKSFMNYTSQNMDECSGVYTYNYMGKDKERPYDQRRLELWVRDENKVEWTFFLNQRGETYERANDEVQHVEHTKYNWTPFNIGNADFDALFMDEVLLVYRCNPEAVPDGSIPDGHTIEGIYIKEADSYVVEKTRYFRKNDPDCCSTVKLRWDVPRLKDKKLYDKLVHLGLTQLAIAGNQDRMKELERVADDYLMHEVYEPEPDEEQEPWQLYNKELKVSYSGMNDRRVLNFHTGGYFFEGGVHGFPINHTVSIRRSDCKVLNWDFFFGQNEAIKPFLQKKLVDALELDERDTEELMSDLDVVLPGGDTWLEDDMIHMIYSPYQSSFVYGMDLYELKIKVSELMPYFTPEAKAMFTGK